MDPSKAHCNDELSIRLLKLSATLISKPLQIFYRSCLDNECVPQTRKKANIVSIHKNVDKQLKKNYRPHYCLFLVTFLKKSYLIYHLNIWMITTY